MSDEVAIKVDHLSKKFCKSLKHTMLYGLQDIAKAAFSAGSVELGAKSGELDAAGRSLGSEPSALGSGGSEPSAPSTRSPFNRRSWLSALS